MVAPWFQALHTCSAVSRSGSRITFWLMRGVSAEIESVSRTFGVVWTAALWVLQPWQARRIRSIVLGLLS